MYLYRKSNLPLSTSRLSSVSQPMSAQRQSHVSRISNCPRPSSAPRAAPMSASRASSATRISNMRDTVGRSSSGLRRYGSDNYLNTPSRFSGLSTPVGRSPAIPRQSSMQPDSTRKLIHENAMKVQEILQRDETFYAELNLKNGLKSMTINQFHLIMKHFVRLISGKDLATFVVNGDPQQGIINFMTQAEYPFKVNKSMLKTPNAPHTFDQVVTMLLWLGNVSSVSTFANDEELLNQILYKKDEFFPSEEYTSMFSMAVQEGYLLWNNESEEHSIVLERLSNSLIAEKLNNKVTSSAELQVLTENLQKKSKELNDNPVQMNNIHQFEQLESKYIEYETKEHDLTKDICEKRDRLAAIQLNWNDKRLKVQQSQTSINELAHQILAQKYSIGDYKKLSEIISRLKTEVGTIQAEIRMIRDEESNQQIIRARLLKKVSESIAKFNEHVMQIVKLLNNTQLVISEQIMNKLHLPTRPSVHLMEEVAEILSHLFSSVTVQKHKLQIEYDRINRKLNAIKTESESLAKEFENAQKNHDKVVFDNKVLEKTCTMKNKKSENCTQHLSKKVEDAKKELQAIKNEIITTNAKKVQLEAENIKIFNNGEAQAMKIIEEKKSIANQIDELDKMLGGPLEVLGFPK